MQYCMPWNLVKTLTWLSDVVSCTSDIIQFILHIPHSPNLINRPPSVVGNHLNTLLDTLRIRGTDTCSQTATQMPKSWARQILAHDGWEDDKLGLDQVEDRVVGEEQTVGYLGRDERCVPCSR